MWVGAFVAAAIAPQVTTALAIVAVRGALWATLATGRLIIRGAGRLLYGGPAPPRGAVADSRIQVPAEGIKQTCSLPPLAPSTQEQHP